MSWRFAAQNCQQSDCGIVSSATYFRFATEGKEIETGTRGHPSHLNCKLPLIVSLRYCKLLRFAGSCRKQGHFGIDDRLATAKHLTLDAFGNKCAFTEDQA